jgi:arylsulfatase A-like enzyme
MIPPYKGPAVNESVNIELGNADEYQLYNLNEDIGQLNNLAATEKDKLEEMIFAFEQIRGSGYHETEALELK